MVSSGFVSESSKSIYQYFLITLYFNSIEATHTIFTLRFLQHYAKIERSQSTNPDDTKQGFILKHYNIFGNASKLFIISVMVTSIQVLMMIIVIIKYGLPYSIENETLVNFTMTRLYLPFWIIRLCITIYCFIKSRQFNDYWFITKEFKYLILSLVIVTLFSILSMVILSSIRTVILSPRLMVVIVIFFTISVFAVWSLISSYISVVWVNKMDNSYHDNDRGNCKAKARGGFQSDPSNFSKIASKNQVVTIFDVLTNNDC